MRPFTIRCLLLLFLLPTIGVFVDGWFFQPSQSPAPRARPLKEGYQKIGDFMTAEEVQNILGPPHSMTRVLKDSALLEWQDADGAVAVLICTWGDKPVVSKEYFAQKVAKQGP